MHSLGEQSELRRSWMRGPRRRRAARERWNSVALLRARAAVAALPLIQLRL